MNLLLRTACVVCFVIASIASTSSAVAGGWGWERGWAWDRNDGTKARGDSGVTRDSDQSQGYTYRSGASTWRLSQSARQRDDLLTGTPLHTGDEAVVGVESARLMIGDKTIATINKGQRLTVLRVDGPWVGDSVRLGGEEKKGWVQKIELAGHAAEVDATMVHGQTTSVGNGIDKT